MAKNYVSKLPRDIREYFHILSPNYPEWLNDYINTPEMLRLQHVSNLCGCQFLAIWDTPRSYSILDHSIACALIVWHFTNNKAQTLAALFHDISSPAFKHCIDIMNGDAKKQESTEHYTYRMLKNAKKIRRLLKRDGIKLKEVKDYRLYPIADNDMPKLSSDRLEYTFMNAYLVRDYKATLPLSKIKKLYQNIIIGKNEVGEEELAFSDYKIARQFIDIAQKLWPNWCNNRYRLVAKYYADILKRSIKAKDLTLEDLYLLDDDKIINILKKSKDKTIRIDIEKFIKAKKWHEGSKKPADSKYCITNYAIKHRYIDPLVCTSYDLDVHSGQEQISFKRLSIISPQAKQCINQIKKYKSPKYAWFDFDML